MIDKEIQVGEFDDHQVHVEEHLRKLLSLDNENLNDNKYKKRIKNHVTLHKKELLKTAIGQLTTEN